jgi:hypothetical protein
MKEPIRLLESVYGNVESEKFPLPMPASEAGLCADGYQRRYLWTDAFGVMAYWSIAEQYEQAGNGPAAATYRSACEKLIDTVHHCLGTPRSNKPQDAMRPDPQSPTGYVGLRIGKVQSRKTTDYGMSYDGQYWHYIDKWLFALARAGRIQEGIAIAKSCFPFFFDSAHGGGIRWKLSVDATPAPGQENAYVGDDTLMALIVFELLQANRQASQDDPDASLSKEIRLLQNAVAGYRPRVTDDPLGWGLENIFDQFLEGNPRRQALAQLQSSALHPSHLSLPFRLYGAMIGSKVSGIGNHRLDDLIQRSLQYEEQVAGNEEHSTINRVMLAMCLLSPGVLGRRDTDPLIQLPT